MMPAKRDNRTAPPQAENDERKLSLRKIPTNPNSLLDKYPIGVYNTGE